jgi:hypothetical protein
MSDTCVGKLEDILDMPSMSNQVSLSQPTTMQTSTSLMDFFRAGRDDIRRYCSRHIAANYHVSDLHDFPEVDDCLPPLRLDANTFG